MKNYVGNGWENQYGITITLKKEKIESIAANGYGEVKLSVVRRKEKDPKSKATHYVIENDYQKPTHLPAKTDGSSKQDWYQKKNDDLPF